MIINAMNLVWSDIYIILYPTEHNARRIRKVDKDFARELDFKDVKFPVEVGDIPKIEKKNSIGINVFGYVIKKNIKSMC